MTPTPKRRAVLYLRLSVAQDDVVSDSIRRQEVDLRGLAEREGWEVVRCLADDGLSGRKARANATEAMRMLRDREADVLAVWKLDRFTRQGLGAIGDLVETLEAVPGSLFVAMTDGLRSDQPAWRLTAAVLSEVARSEADSTALRVSSAIRSNRAQGRFVGGTVPFGYRPAAREGGGRTLVPHPPEVAVIRATAERILRDESQASIVEDLTRRGVATTRSPYRVAEINGLASDGLDRGSWSYSGLNSVWTGESLLGRLSRSRKSIDARGKTTKTWEIIRDAQGLPLVAYEPLLDAATVERLRGHLRDPKNPASKRTEPRTRRARLLSGVIYCAECGQRLWVSGNGDRIVYSCIRRAGRCVGPNIKAENAERAVTERFLGLVGSEPDTRDVEVVTAPDTIAALADVEAAIRETTGELVADGADGQEILRRLAVLKAIRLEHQSIRSSVTLITERTGRTIAEAWAASTVDERRAQLLRKIDHVTLAPTASKGHTGYHPERISIEWGENADAHLTDPNWY
jgi:site-specific DNA recombinase